MSNKIFVQFYGRLGLSFINIPEITDLYTDTNVISSRIEKSNTTGLNTRLGVNIGTEICKSLSFFIASDYVSTFNSNINYSTRNLSSEITPIDPDLANEIAFNKKSFNFSSLNINFGIHLDLDRNVSRTKATDYNSSRSNRTTSIKDLDNGGDGDKTRANDYNSSRSNRTTSIKEIDDGGGDDKTRANDYNSSRSNRTTSIKDLDNGDDDDEGNKIRTSDITSLKEEEIILNGNLLGILLVSRKFEFKKVNGDLIFGTINSKISDKQLTEYSSRYLNNTCKIHMLISTTRKGEISYEILEISEQ